MVVYILKNDLLSFGFTKKLRNSVSAYKSIKTLAKYHHLFHFFDNKKKS